MVERPLAESRLARNYGSAQRPRVDDDGCPRALCGCCACRFQAALTGDGLGDSMLACQVQLQVQSAAQVSLERHFPLTSDAIIRHGPCHLFPKVAHHHSLERPCKGPAAVSEP